MKMKNITNTASAFLCNKVRAKTAYAWTSDVHSYIAEKALELLTIEKKLRPAAFYKDWHEEIKQGAVAPDKSGDIDEGPGMHYYSCMNAKGKELDESNGFFRNRLGDFAPSARTLFRANYTSAISLYKSGKLCLEKAGLLAYAHGGYFELGKQLGSFGYSVRKNKKRNEKKR